MQDQRQLGLFPLCDKPYFLYTDWKFSSSNLGYFSLVEFPIVLCIKVMNETTLLWMNHVHGLITRWPEAGCLSYMFQSYYKPVFLLKWVTDTTSTSFHNYPGEKLLSTSLSSLLTAKVRNSCSGVRFTGVVDVLTLEFVCVAVAILYCVIKS